MGTFTFIRRYVIYNKLLFYEKLDNKIVNLINLQYDFIIGWYWIGAYNNNSIIV